jgi:neutral trehalase
VQITNPSWLSGIEGWAPNSVFRNIERNADGKRTYVEEDVYWDEHSNPYRQNIVAKINELSHEDRCREIDPQSVALSPTRGSKESPVFFVTCGSGKDALNVWFNVK